MSLIQLFDYSIQISNTFFLSLILLLPIVGIGVLMLVDRPRHFELVGMMLGILLNIPYLLLLNILAEAMAWWEYAPSTNSYYSMPIEALLGWSVFWGALLPYLFRRLPTIIPIALALLIDVLLMPQMNGLFALTDRWLIGEGVLIALCLVPSLLIFKLTVSRQHVMARALIQSYIWGGWMVFLIPSIMLQFEGQDIFSIFGWSHDVMAMFAVGMLLSMAIGYAGLWEFAVKGNGTPIPFDPPQKLVTTGVYRYVANPLQISTLLMFICIAIAYQSWFMIAPMIAHFIYCEIFVRWHHSIDIQERFAEDWLEYKANVRNWLPRMP